jgi:uncharacterized protein (TIGR02217 family)
MTFLTFPTLSGLTFPVKKSPKFQTLVFESVNGVSTMQSTQPYARYMFDLPFEFLRSDNVNLEMQQLISFFQACLGQAIPFNFVDPDDNSVTTQVIGVGDGVTTSFPFVRTMVNVVDPLQNVNAAGLLVYVNAVLQTLGANYSILATSQWATNYGVQFAVAPPLGQLVTATFSFSWLCKFDADTTDFSKFMYLNGASLWEAKSVKFTSLLQ